VAAGKYGGNEMKSTIRHIGVYILLACAAISIAAAYFIATQKTRGDIRTSGERQLQIIALDLEAVLEKYETLPFVLAFQPDIRNALIKPANQDVINHLNTTIQSIQRQAKVSAIYVMDGKGNTLASSNWDQPENQNFIGKNFSFRPYFGEAMSGKTSRFYAIGNTTNEPGYFIAQPVYSDGTPHGTGIPIGVVAVKISLSDFERTWASSEDPIALMDSTGVVFLSNKIEWRYRSLSSLNKAAQDTLARTRQYGGQAILPLPTQKELKRAGFGPHIEQPINRLGWKLMLFPSETHVTRAGIVSATVVALLFAIIGSSLWAADQRRRRMEERLISRKALQNAAEELERRIAQRTQELLLANQTLEVKFVKLKETERLLRSTQNELVQAGKLTMLGQMAAGVTHELNQPLAAIHAFSDNAVTFLARQQPDHARENLAHISAAAARMGAIISQLKGFARKSTETLSTVDLAQSIRTSALLLENDFLRNNANLEIKILERAQVKGDSVRIEQVLINLLRNALDATEGCTVKNVIATLERDGNDALVRVRDSGPGIPQEVVAHLFEPFFTTKPSGKGLGLGLAISSSIVQAMDGQLTGSNHAEGGAEFVVRFALLEMTNNKEEHHVEV
jgi:two-component system, NtrC family, C4-dicarboxylate transport sensor histidine kinase DctB